MAIRACLLLLQMLLMSASPNGVFGEFLIAVVNCLLLLCIQIFMFFVRAI